MQTLNPLGCSRQRASTCAGLFPSPVRGSGLAGGLGPGSGPSWVHSGAGVAAAKEMKDTVARLQILSGAGRFLRFVFDNTDGS